MSLQTTVIFWNNFSWCVICNRKFRQTPKKLPKKLALPNYQWSKTENLMISVSYSMTKSLPPANEVWGKVIFSVACVKNSVHGGRGGIPAYLAGLQGVGIPACLAGLQAQGGKLRSLAWMGGSQHVLRQTPPPQQTATAAGGTHPTGMHSCLYCIPKIAKWTTSQSACKAHAECMSTWIAIYIAIRKSHIQRRI